MSPAPRGISARFDSLRARGRSFTFVRPVGTIVAATLEEVVPALKEVEREVARGRHAAGFIVYEAAGAFDPALDTRPPDPRLPLAWFAIFEERVPSDPLPVPTSAGAEAQPLASWRGAPPLAAYAARVAAIRELIAAGDTYQVNYTFPLEASFAGDEESLYARLCHSQEAGYCALLRLPEVSLVSASPELFFAWEGDSLEMRPMKGTRARGRWSAEDEAAAADLIGSPKERAENLMIVDLLRNDAGRISEFGSVRVDPLFEVERYPTVHQLTSTIRSVTRPGTSLTDILTALFPSGSVTGAPKVRTMEIIAALEGAPRGVYTGAIGFVSPGETVWNVPIRTLVLHRGAGTAEMGVGSGVTFDSSAEAEYRECLQKAAFAHHRPRAFELLETMLWEPGEGIFLLDAHLGRLRDSARYFSIPLDVAEVRGLLEARLGMKESSLRVRLLVSRAGAVAIETHPLGERGERPLLARLSDLPVDPGDPMLYHKTTWRDAYDTRLARTGSAGEVLLVNERGELTEFANGNLVVRRGTESLTPPIGSGLLPGTFRDHLLRRGEIVERVLMPADLESADEVFLINSVRRWVPVEIEGFPRPHDSRATE